MLDPRNQYVGEKGYLKLLSDIIDHGVDCDDRTGEGVRKKFKATTYWNVGEAFPFFTARQTPFRFAFEEWMLFLRGQTDTKILEERGINFWKGNTSREFLDNRGLNHLPAGDMGKAYGYQFRSFSGEVDQLREVYDSLRTNPYGRRHVVTFWNPSETAEMALPPCWYQHVFMVEPSPDGDILHLDVYNRSLDATYGYAFAVMQYAFYLKAMAKLLGMRVGWMVTNHTDTHIYQNAIEFATELSKRETYSYHLRNSFEISKPLNTLEDLLSLEISDLDIIHPPVNKSPFTANKPPMAV